MVIKQTGDVYQYEGMTIGRGVVRSGWCLSNNLSK